MVKKKQVVKTPELMPGDPPNTLCAGATSYEQPPVDLDLTFHYEIFGVDTINLKRVKDMLNDYGAKGYSLKHYHEPQDGHHHATVIMEKVGLR